ncbi:hypothetical protein [Anaerocolumna sp. MB42-C2]|uniref:hypothetical protein n=1 Tax=Anaerocolumna sp. MB42-C2 TaxID=3070997 RepID=UPI0027E1D7B6|nr:hypothetical protein [Anaerocolumna sp. MB42-C2]WMJ85643.1 hypothetical protein RBU59_16405 [Anaerocolumna sp. MB42-C2]
MKTKMKFGECLNLLLSTFDISANRLSKAINVDSSLVNRWIHGKRIPPLSTSYITNISEYLSKNVLNSFQLKLLNDIFLKVINDNEESLSNKDKIQKILLESQGNSLESKHTSLHDPAVHMVNQNFKSKLMPDTIGLSNEDSIILGVNNVFTAGAQLIETAAIQKSSKDNTIYISLNNDTDMLSTLPTNYISWQNSLLKAIDNGWTVLFLLRFNNNTARTIRFIDFAKPLILTGKFIPYYFKKYDAITSGMDALIIPDIGALACFITKPYAGIDSAMIFKNKPAINVLCSYFNVLITAHSQPLMKYYTDEHIREYSKHLMENEESIGVRYLNKYGVSLQMVPEKLYKRLLERSSLPKEERFSALEYYKRRLHAFMLNTKHYEYKDIFFMESLRHIFKHGQILFYYNAGNEKLDITKSETIDLLRNVINLLKTNNNYHIALVHQNKQNELISGEFDCLLKERKALFLEAYPASGYLSDIRLSVEEPMLIKAYEEYIKDIWEQIAPINKDKKEVIRFFEAEIQLLEDCDT